MAEATTIPLNLLCATRVVEIVPSSAFWMAPAGAIGCAAMAPLYLEPVEHVRVPSNPTELWRASAGHESLSATSRVVR
jgi:hypothetical protein